MYTSEEEKQRKIRDAKVQITKAEAIKVLLSNNDLAATIFISGMEMGVSSNKWLLPVIEEHIKEIKKFLNGESNLYE